MRSTYELMDKDLNRGLLVQELQAYLEETAKVDAINLDKGQPRGLIA